MDEPKFTPFGIAIEDIRTGDHLELNYPTGQVRRMRQPRPTHMDEPAAPKPPPSPDEEE